MFLFDDKLFVKVTLVVIFIIFAYVMVMWTWNPLASTRGRWTQLVEYILIPLALIFIILFIKYLFRAPLALFYTLFCCLGRSHGQQERAAKAFKGFPFENAIISASSPLAGLDKNVFLLLGIYLLGILLILPLKGIDGVHDRRVKTLFWPFTLIIEGSVNNLVAEAASNEIIAPA